MPQIRTSQTSQPSAMPAQTYSFVSAATPMGGFPSLPGIDTRAGLAAALGKPDFYTRMLMMFRNDGALFSRKFAAALKDGDPMASERTAHSLKSMAGTIRATHLQEAAAGLEQVCRMRAAPEIVEAHFERVLSELDPVLTGLQSMNTSVPLHKTL